MFITSKLSCLSIAWEDNQPSEEEKNAKEDKSKRLAKKIWFFEGEAFGKSSAWAAAVADAEEDVYLQLNVPEPLIAMPIEPPELG